MKKKLSFQQYYEDVLIDQLGDTNSPFWNTYIKSACIKCFVLLKPDEQEAFLESLRKGQYKKILSFLESTLDKEDYQHIAEMIQSELTKDVAVAINDSYHGK